MLTAENTAAIPSDETIERTAKALEANGIQALIAANGAEARRLFFELLPEGAQVHQGASRTLEELGITAEIEKSGRYQALRPVIRAMDRATQGQEIRRLGANPDYMVGSVQAVTEDGHILAASATGSQLGPYVSGAGRVIWVVGAQKIVPDLKTGLRRIEEEVFPLENERTRAAYGITTSLNKLVIFYKERPGRITLILVKEKLGF